MKKSQRRSKCLDPLKKERWPYFPKREIVTTVVLDKQKTVTAIVTWKNVASSVGNVEKANLRLDTWFLHYDNAPAHQAYKNTECLREVRVKLLVYSSQSRHRAVRFCTFSIFDETIKRMQVL